jgi:MFS family permease
MNKRKSIFFVLCWIGTVIYFSERWIFSPMIPYVMVDFSIDRVTAGFLGAAPVSGAFFMLFLAGFLSDRVGRKPIILLGLLGISLFTILAGFTTSYRQMYVIRFLTGLVEPCFFIPLIAYFMELFPHSPAFFTTAMISGTSIGWFVGPLLSGWSLGTLGSWRVPFWITGAAGLLLLAVLFSCWYDQSRSETEVHAQTLAKSDVSKAIRFTMLVTLAFVVFFDGIAEFGFSTWLPSFLKEERKFSIIQSGIIASVWGIGQFFGRPILGLISDRTGYRHVGTPGAFAMGLALYLVVKSQTYFAFIFWQVIAGFVGGAIMGSVWTFSAIFFGKTKGTALGFISTVGCLGVLAGPIIGGYIGHHYSLEKSLTMIGPIPAVIAGLVFLSSFIWVRGNIRSHRSVVSKLDKH